MNAKEQKYLGLLKRLMRLELPAQDKEYVSAMTELAAFDYGAAVTVWEFFLTESDSALGRSDYAELLIDKTEKLMENVSASKFVRALSESTALRGAIYRRSATALTRSETIGYEVQFVLGGKFSESEDVLKNAMKNNGGAEYGKFLAAVVDRIIIELVKKNPAKPSFPKKQATHILEYADKIKGPEKALIAQRIREL